MAAANTDKWRKGAAQWTGNIGSAGVTDGTVTTIPLVSASGLPTDTAVMITINRVDANGDATNNYEGVIGVVSGNNITDCVRGAEGTAQGWTAGTVVEILHTAKNLNDLVDGLLVEHNQDGTHKSALVTTLKSTGAEIDTGTEDAKIVTPKAIADSYIAQRFYNPNVIINGNFVVNQRVYVSDATLAAGAYGHDRWKAGAGGGDYTFTQLPSSTQITIKADKSLIQVIEDKNVIGGTYTLSWEGTAKGRFGIDSATPSGDYAASPITITKQTAGTVMSVEFNAGTLGKVQLNSGSVALPFQARSIDEEERACKRYCRRWDSADFIYTVFAMAEGTTSTQAFAVDRFDIPMRVPPNVTTSGSFELSSIPVTNIDVTRKSRYSILWFLETDGGLTAGHCYRFTARNTTSAYVIYDSEL